MEFVNPRTFAHTRKRGRRRSGASVRMEREAPRRVSSAAVWKALGFLVLTGAVVAGVLTTPKMVETVSSQRVEQVIIEGDINFVSEQDVLRAVNSFISESLLLVDMGRIKLALEAMPWIRTVTIRREWPDTLVLDLVEQKAIARWGENRLLNQDGAIFAPDNIVGLEQLSILSGPDGSERRVMEQYQLFSQLLYQRGLKIAELNLNDRGAWKLILGSGVQVNIGNSDVMARMRRLVEFVDPVFKEKMAGIESIDLRYTSGLAVKNKQITGDEVVSL